MENSILVQRFIGQIWNEQAFDRLDDFLHPHFKDHSLLPSLPPGKEGTKQWIIQTGLSFRHQTIIESQITEGDQCMIRINMKLQHTGVWRGIAPTGFEVYAAGFRHFKMQDGRIMEHWALIDGQAIENQLREASHGCRIVG